MMCGLETFFTGKVSLKFKHHLIKINNPATTLLVYGKNNYYCSCTTQHIEKINRIIQMLKPTIIPHMTVSRQEWMMK